MRASIRSTSGVAALLALAMCVRCAHIQPLDGGAADTTPPELVAIAPADSSRGLGPRPTLHLRFSETLHDASVSGALRTYPAPPRPDVRVRGAEVEIRYRDSLPADTTLVVVLGRTLQDAKGRDNKLPHELWFVFATGETLRGGGVRGRVTVKGKPEPQAALRFEPLVAATDSGAGRDTMTTAAPPRTAPRRPRYPVAATDTEGLFTMLGLPTGVPFVLRAFVDRNASFDVDEGELAAAYPETLLLAPGEVRRGLEWNLVDPNEPGRVHGVVFNRSGVEGPIAVALRTLDADTTAAAPARTDSATTAAPTVADSVAAPTPAVGDSARKDVAGSQTGATATAADTLPTASPGDWATAYAALSDVGARTLWQVVYASPRGDYSIRIQPGRHRLAAFVDVSGDSLPGTCLAPDSTQRVWEPLWIGGVLEIGPAGEVRPRAIDIDVPH